MEQLRSGFARSNARARARDDQRGARRAASVIEHGGAAGTSRAPSRPFDAQSLTPVRKAVVGYQHPLAVYGKI